MNNSNKIKRVPSRLSGRSFSNGIMFRGGSKQIVAVRTKDGNLSIDTKEIFNRHTNKALHSFFNMIGVAIGGIVESIKVLRKNPRISLIRLFKYHGAEHKVIHCYEEGMELTVENAKKCTTYHPRCGTSLAANVLILEGIICLIVPSKVRNALCGAVDIILFFAALFAGFKMSRYSASHNNKLSKIISVPGKLLQKITALEPDEEMLECGIEAAKKIVQSEYI